MKNLIEIFYVFFKVSSFTFGGGYAMLPLLEREVVSLKKWITSEELVDYYAISQTLPGIIAVNVSIFIGRQIRGKRGALVAALGIVTPCLLIISVIAFFFSSVQNNLYVSHALKGMMLGVSALILATVFDLVRKTVVSKLQQLIFLGAFLLIFFTSISPTVVIVLTTIFAFIHYAIRKGLKS